MEEFRKNKPSLGPALTTANITGIDQNRKQKQALAIAAMRNSKNVGTPGLLDRIGLGASSSSEKRNNVPKPNEVPTVKGGSSVSVTNNPIFNFNGPITAETKQEFIKLSNDSNYDLLRMLQDAEKNKKRIALE